MGHPLEMGVFLEAAGSLHLPQEFPCMYGPGQLMRATRAFCASKHVQVSASACNGLSNRAHCKCALPTHSPCRLRSNLPSLTHPDPPRLQS